MDPPRPYVYYLKRTHPLHDVRSDLSVWSRTASFLREEMLRQRERSWPPRSWAHGRVQSRLNAAESASGRSLRNEVAAGELWPKIDQYLGDLDVELGEPSDDQVQERRGSAGVLVVDQQLGDRSAGGGVDRGGLPDGDDPFVLADLEAVRGHQIPTNGAQWQNAPWPPRSLMRLR